MPTEAEYIAGASEFSPGVTFQLGGSKMGCTPLTFQITPAQLESLKTVSAKNGLHLSGTQGDGVPFHGGLFNWSYVNGTLTLTCTQLPHFAFHTFDCAYVTQHLTDLVQSV